MDEKEKILQELDQTAPALMGIDKQMPYNAPEGYFDLFPLSLLGKIGGMQKPVVPDGYFETLPAALLLKIRSMESSGELEAGELDTIAPVLGGINRQMPYSIPQGYFENFQVKPDVYEAPVIPISVKTNKLRWAVAASVVIISGLFAWFYLFNNKTVNREQAVVKETNTEITDTSFAAALAGIEDNSIHSELNSDDNSNNTLSSLYYLSTDNIETALQDFSEDEIRSQLNDRVVIKNKS